MDSADDRGHDIRLWVVVGLWGLMFATIFGEGISALREAKWIWGLTLSIIGIVGALIVDRIARGRRVNAATWTAVATLMLTWVFLGYDIYDRHIHLLLAEPLQPIASTSQGEGNEQMAGLFQEYGNPTGCGAILDGTKLSKWRDNYEVVLICGINEPPTDRY